MIQLSEVTLTNKEMLEVLKSAKKRYESTDIPFPYTGMCLAIQDSIREMLISSRKYNPNIKISTIMPVEFNREFCEADFNSLECGFWWDVSNKRSRLYAFDKLISCYEQKIKEEEIEK